MSKRTLPYDLGPDTTRKTFIDSPVVRYKDDAINVEETIEAHGNEITRLKTQIGTTADIYSYRDNKLPVFPSTPKNGYYLSLYGGTNYDNQTLTLPAGVETGSVFSINNESFTANVLLGGQIDGATSLNIPAQNMAFLVKTDTGWTIAFTGFVPTSLSALIRDIKEKLPSGGLTIQEIEAALKDRLHTFREIQTEFKDQLHTIDELVNDGMSPAFAEYDFVTSLQDPLPTFLDFGKLYFYGVNTVTPPLNDSFIVFRIPEYQGLLLKSVQINGNTSFVDKSRVLLDGKNWTLCKVAELIPTGVDFEISFDFYIQFSGSSSDEPAQAIYTEDEIGETWELESGTDGHLINTKIDGAEGDVADHVIRDNFSASDVTFDEFGNITFIDKSVPTEYTEISSDTELDGFRNYIVDTTSNTVTINIPYEEVSAFSVRDATKEFDTNNCIITIRDDVDAIAHTATLDKRDKGYIFYNNGTDWNYGEIGKGAVVAVASDHCAHEDFPECGMTVYKEEDLTRTTTDSTSYVNKVTMTRNFHAGDYIVDVSYNFDFKEDNKDFYSQVTLDGSLLGEEHIEEIKEKTRDQYIPCSRRFIVTLTEDSHTFALDYKTSDAVIDAIISSARIMVTKATFI